MVLVAVAFVRSSADTPSDAAGTSQPVPVEAPGLAAGTTAPLGGKSLGEGVAGEVSGRTPLRGFGEVSATVTTENGRICEVCLMSATTPEQRERGLMEVTDEGLGGYDGMLFEYDDEIDGSFWMRNTPTPLSIAYFDEQGRLVATADMEPCEDRADCPGYPAGERFAYALEVPQGMLDEVGAIGDATLRIHARRCPLAAGS
ncbi:MAG: hypothetical protein JWO77_3354 [Ilumatobacteraceae bacterium]|nr:hypothetical protein [Ilumatobacteraceae bacterium]